MSILFSLLHKPGHDIRTGALCSVPDRFECAAVHAHRVHHRRRGRRYPAAERAEGTQTVMQLLTGGFASNATTALAYILLGTFATCIATTGLADILSKSCHACSADTSWRSSVC